MCVPLRDAEVHLPMFFSHLRNFTYPHRLIDLAFLVSDSKDHTLTLLKKQLEKVQADPDPLQPFGEISVIEKDFGQKVQQDVENRHGFAAQAGRRKTMAQARNWLLSATLRPYHSWVYWRDADVETAPPTILEDLMRHNKDVIVPSKSSYGLGLVLQSVLLSNDANPCICYFRGFNSHETNTHFNPLILTFFFFSFRKNENHICARLLYPLHS